MIKLEKSFLLICLSFMALPLNCSKPVSICKNRVHTNFTGRPNPKSKAKKANNDPMGNLLKRKCLVTGLALTAAALTFAIPLTIYAWKTGAKKS